jgi:hypothetical protein
MRAPVQAASSRWAVIRNPSHFRTPAAQEEHWLFDDLVGAGEKGFGDGQPDRLGGF